MDQCEKLPSIIGVEPDATVTLWDWPYPPEMEPISGRKLHPVRHGIADIMAVGLGDLAGNDGILQHGESIFTGALVTLFPGHGEVPFRCGMRGYADTAGGHQKRATSLHDIDHLLVQRDLDRNFRGILGLISRLVINRALGKLRATSKKKEWNQKKWKWMFHQFMENRKTFRVKRRIPRGSPLRKKPSAFDLFRARPYPDQRTMIKADDFNYAMANTRVVVSPTSAIETYGRTSFRFRLLTEPMDEIGSVKLRKGVIHAERPRILAPQYISKLLLEGFGDKAQMFAGWIEDQRDFHLLRYGFSLKKTDLSEHLLRENKEDAIMRLEEEIRNENDPMTALIEGIDDAWEVCLMKFTMDLIQRSAGENVAEWKRRGFLP